MEYRIEKKPAFKVMGVSKMFSYESANKGIPQFWDEVYVTQTPKPVLGMYGVCFDDEMAGNQFRYLIADDYPADAEMGMQDPEYYAEVWIPVKERS